MCRPAPGQCQTVHHVPGVQARSRLGVQDAAAAAVARSLVLVRCAPVPSGHCFIAIWVGGWQEEEVHVCNDAPRLLIVVLVLAQVLCKRHKHLPAPGTGCDHSNSCSRRMARLQAHQLGTPHPSHT